MLAFLYKVMQDPVRLPTSGKVVDRSVAARLLETEGKDPFTRTALTWDMVEEEPKLKAEILAWIEERRRTC